MGFFSMFNADKRAGELVVVFDIGSASVGGALVACRGEDKPLIVHATRKEMPLEEELDIDRLRFFMRKALGAVASELAKEGPSRAQELGLPKVPMRAYCMLGAPWYALQTRTVERTKEKPFTISEHDIEEIVKSEMEAFQKSEEVRSLAPEGELASLEHHAISVKLNGYETARPAGKEARTLEVTTLMSVAPRQSTEDIRAEVARSFPIEDEHILFHSFPMALYDTLRDLRPDECDFLAVDVSGEITDMVLVRDGIIQKTTSFPVGKRTLIRSLARELKASTDEALTLMRAERENVLDKRSTEHIHTAIENASKKWMDQLGATVHGISEEMSIPHIAYLTADPDAEHIFIHLLGHEELGRSTFSGKAFSAHLLRGEPEGKAGLHRNVSFYNQDTKRDIFLMTGAIFACKIK